MTDCEILKHLSKVYAKKRARCSSYCSMWNIFDKDCEAMGVNHRSPSKCPIFLNKQLTQIKSKIQKEYKNQERESNIVLLKDIYK